MITKDEIRELKEYDLEKLYALIRTSTNPRELLFVLENLGFLPIEFDGDIFVPLLFKSNSGIRFWAVKNLGKVSNGRFLELLSKIAKTDHDSLVRREAVSSIGRMRTTRSIPVLTELLADNDPKVVLQAIRGLLVFKKIETVQISLKSLATHQNEIIQNVIRMEFSAGTIVRDKNMSHVNSPDFMRDVVVQGDVRKILRHVPNDAIHLTFTSPPYYNARDYSIYPSYSAYLGFLEEVFKEVNRVTKEGRFLIVNTSPVILPRVSRAYASKRYPIPFDLHSRLVEDNWEFIDDVIWEKPESSVKNRNAGFLQHRKPLGYKPNPVTEYLMVYRKKTDKLLDWNMGQYPKSTVEESKIKGMYDTSNIWRIDPVFDAVHSAVFPLELCKRVIKYYSYKGDLVFDPFAGSGTLGSAAKILGRYFFLTEQEPKYVERIRHEMEARSPLFDHQGTRFYTLDQFAEISQEKTNNDNH